MWKTLKKLFLDAILPQFCLGCKREGEILCEDCLSTVDVFDFIYCPFCQKPKRMLSPGKCKTHGSSALNGLFSAASYKDNLVRQAIRKFKYEPFLKTLAKSLAFLIISHILKSGNENFFKQPNILFVPAPLSGFRNRWRGYNQSEELAKILAGFFNVPIESGVLVKTKNTPAQTELKFSERQKNVKAVFLIKNPEKIKNKKIFLIDDVFTTGATMEECSRVLKAAGAASVWGVVAARETLE